VTTSLTRWLLLAFLATIAIDWPSLPSNARLTDVIFVAAALAVLSRATPSRPSLTSLDAAIAGYLGGSVLAVLLSPDPRAGAVELVRQGYVVAIYAVIAIATRQGLSHTIGTGLAWSGGGLGVLGLAAVAAYYLAGVRAEALTPMMSLPYLGYTLRIEALTASGSMLACVLAVSVPFILRHPAIASSAARWWPAAWVTAATAMLTFSHSIAGVAVASVAACRVWLTKTPARLAAMAAAAAVVLAFTFAATVSIRSIGSLRDATEYQYGIDGGRIHVAGVAIDYQTMSYWRLKEVAWNAFMSRPLVGIGLDRFHTVTEAAFQDGRLTAPYRAIDPHSTLLGRLAETGLAGGLTLLMLWSAIAMTCRRVQLRRPSWMATAAAAALLGTLINSANADVMNFRFAWVALGLLRGLDDA
jgi:hypothetical protein